MERKLRMYIKDASQALAEYHAFMRTQENQTLFQTPEWGEVKAKGEWTKDILLVMNEQHCAVAAAMILYRKLPIVNRYLAYAPRGIITDYHDEQQFERVIATLKGYLKSKKVFNFKIDPEIRWHEWQNNFEMIENSNNNESIRELLLKTGFVSRPLDLGFDGIQPRMTMIVPLEDRGKGIIEQFTSKERYKVNFARKKGVVCYQGTLEDMDDYEYLNQMTAQRDQYIARSQEYLTVLYQTLHDEGMMELYFAKLDYSAAKQFTNERIQQAEIDIQKIDQQLETIRHEKRKANLLKQKESLQNNVVKYRQEIANLDSFIEQYPNGKLLSGALVATYGDTAYYLYGANDTAEAGLNANKALQTWIMQRLYDEKGVRFYDMFGVASSQEDHSGIRQFKQSFDPELVEYIGEFDLPINRFWFAMFQNIMPGLMKLKQILLLRHQKKA